MYFNLHYLRILSVTVRKNLRDPATAKPGDRIVTPVAALSIARMGVTTPLYLDTLRV